MSVWVAFPLGFTLLFLTWMSVVFTVVLPRAQFGPSRVSGFVNRSVRAVFVAISRITDDYEKRDAILAPTAPIALLVQLVAWLFFLGSAFVIMLIPFTDSAGDALTQVAAAMFTLGIADKAAASNDAITILAGASGFIVITVQIAYLPSLYNAFNRREALVTLMATRAGEPAWGPEVLIRHQLVGIVDLLPEFYADWEQWSAEVSESHASYPVLMLFRSPDPWGSWVLSLLAVLDAAAMQLSLSPSTAPSQARLSLRMGFTALRRLSSSVGWKFDADPLPQGPIELTFEEFSAAVDLLVDVGFPIERSAQEAWPHFVGWRVNYEELIYRWCDLLVAPPAPWSGSRKHLEHHQVAPKRPPHRSPDNHTFYERPGFEKPTR